jgi:hypothetical protein
MATRSIVLKRGLTSFAKLTGASTDLPLLAGQAQHLLADRCEPARHVYAVAAEHHDAIADPVELHPPAVELDLVNPLRPDRRLSPQDWGGGDDERNSLGHAGDVGTVGRLINTLQVLFPRGLKSIISVVNLEDFAMDIRSLLIEQRQTGDKFRVAERDALRLQKMLSGSGIDDATRRQAEEALTYGQEEMARLSKQMLELDVSVTIAALRAP